MSLKFSPRIALVVIASLFILPLILAWLLYSGVIEFEPGPTRNHGALVQPPVPVDWDSQLEPVGESIERPDSTGYGTLVGHWVVLHVVPAGCASGCLAAIANLRQIHKAMGREQARIRIALLLDSTDRPELTRHLREIHDAFHLVENPGAGLRSVLKDVAGEFSAQPSGANYLIDPLGNIMMYYRADSDPNDLRLDLKHLLSWSKLDKPQ